MSRRFHLPNSRGAEFNATQPDLDKLVYPKRISSDEIRFQSDTHGRIRHVFLSFEDAPPLYVRSLIRQMPDDVHFSVLSSGEKCKTRFDEFVAKHQGLERRAHFLDLGTYGLIWARELFSSYESPKGTALRPHNIDPFDTELFPRMMELDGRYLGVDERKPEFTVPKGGYVVSNDTTVFVSKRYSEVVYHEKGKSLKQMSSELVQSSGKKVELVENPVHDPGYSIYRPHTDLWMTPMGPIEDGGLKDNVLVVGDPCWGARCVHDMPEDERDFLLKAIIFKQIVDQNLIELRKSGNPDARYWADLVLDRPNIQKELDGYKERMDGLGYELRWIPYLPLPPVKDYAAIGVITFNNILQQNYVDSDEKNQRTAWMPTYGLPTLEEPAKAVYEGLGYGVKLVEGLDGVVGGGGSLRCLTQVGIRGPYNEGRVYRLGY